MDSGTARPKPEIKTDSKGGRKNTDFIDRISHIRHMLTTPQMYRLRKEGRSTTVRPESAHAEIDATPVRPGTSVGPFKCNTAFEPIRKIEQSREAINVFQPISENINPQEDESPPSRRDSKNSFKIRDSRKSQSTILRKRSSGNIMNFERGGKNSNNNVMFCQSKTGRNLSISTSSFMKSGCTNLDSFENSTSTFDNSGTSDNNSRNYPTLRKPIFTPVRPKSVNNLVPTNTQDMTSAVSNLNTSGTMLSSTRHLGGVSLQTRKIMGRLCKSKDSLHNMSMTEDDIRSERGEDNKKHRKHSLGVELTTLKNPKNITQESEELESSDDDSESSKSREKVMEWLSVQQNVVTPDLLAHCEPISSTVAEQPSTSNDQTKMGKTVAFKPGTVIAPTLTTTGVADGNNSEDDYERALVRQMSFSGSTTVIPKEDDEVVGETDIRVNRYEQSLVKYIEQLQGRFDHLETETNRVVSEFETMNKKWALDKERLEITQQERIILGERNVFMRRQRDVDKQRLQSALKQYHSVHRDTSNVSRLNPGFGITSHDVRSDVRLSGAASLDSRNDVSDMDDAITQVETLLMNLGRISHSSECEQTMGMGDRKNDGNKRCSKQENSEYLQDMHDELNSTRLSLTMTENRNHYLSQEIASLTIQLKNSNRTIENLRKHRDEQKHAIKQVLEMSNFKTRNETNASLGHGSCDESSSVLTQTICSRVSKSDFFIKDLEKLLAQGEVTKINSHELIDDITSLIDDYYVTIPGQIGGSDSTGTPVMSHRRRQSLKKGVENGEKLKRMLTSHQLDFI